MKYRSRLTVACAVAMWSWVVIVVVAGLAIAAVGLGSLTIHLKTEAGRSERQNELVTAAFNRLDIADFRFARVRLRPNDRFYLVVGNAARRDPYTTRSGRNFALWYLYPAVAVDRIAEADAVIGVDGTDIGFLTGGRVVERHGSVSVARIDAR